MDKTHNKYHGYKVSPGAQLYIEDIEKDLVELKNRNLVIVENAMIAAGIADKKIKELEVDLKIAESNVVELTNKAELYHDNWKKAELQVKELKEEMEEHLNTHNCIRSI